MTDAIDLRPERPADEELLRRIYAGTRAEELALVPWDEAQKALFLRMQFDAQRRHYRTHFPDAAFDVIVAGGRPVGRLYVDRRLEEIRVVDIALLPEERGQGVGGRLLAALIAEGARSDRPVRIHVERTNRARSLYDRLGFVSIAEDGVYHLLERRPG